MSIPSETKILLGIGGATVALIIGAVVLFSRPTTPVTKEQLIPKSAYTKGDVNAKTTLVEFSDFQCPACKAYQSVISEILKTNGAQIYFVYRNFPLPQHTFGESAAEAAEAAGKQGRFWEMHDLLFARQEDMSDTLWVELAKELKLDEGLFATDMKSQTVKDKIANDKADGASLGINSTPTFFLNGIKIPPMSLEEFKQKVIDTAGNP